jgi:hypothetical protein
LRHAAAYGEASPKASRQIRNREREEFLICIESAAVLGGEHPTDSGCFDSTEEEAGEGQWQEVVEV